MKETMRLAIGQIVQFKTLSYNLLVRGEITTIRTGVIRHYITDDDSKGYIVEIGNKAFFADSEQIL